MFGFEKIKGYAFQDEKTKRLVERLPKKSIAVLAHEDIDMTAADMLISCGVKAIINEKTSMTGMFFHQGVETLLKANIPVFDVDSNLLTTLEGQLLLIDENYLYTNNDGIWIKITSLKKYTFLDIEQLKQKAITKFSEQFKAFAGNSLSYGEKELDIFVEELQHLPILRQFKDKEVLIVARGANYEKDLRTLKPIIKKRKLVTIAVDGGADGLIRIGIKPDYIVGDMDSVSEKSLRSGAQLLVHSYRDGRSPGEARIRSLQLPFSRLRFLGTSEDVAILFADCSGAGKLYTVGTRIGMNEFLEKGRIGMGSSLLTRMKVGHALIDLKGIHLLYSDENETQSKRLVLIPAFVMLALLFF
ncbi:putative cytokinetic ring protein SteA [Bacillaceae bacterium IKA-2]|nr:putative cytokinetic ring protein SteA [Bacillaceae bacterium IKA-2]